MGSYRTQSGNIYCLWSWIYVGITNPAVSVPFFFFCVDSGSCRYCESAHTAQYTQLIYQQQWLALCKITSCQHFDMTAKCRSNHTFHEQTLIIAQIHTYLPHTERILVFTCTDWNNYLISFLALRTQTIVLVQLYCSLEPNSYCDLCYKATY